MPRDLNETYERILSQFNSELPRQRCYQKYMQRALLWLCYATRPLRLDELSEAIVIEEEDIDLDSDSRLHDPFILLSLGQGLLEYDRKRELVSLGHSSIKTFLTSAEIRHSTVANFALDEKEAHGVIMRTCLTYLGFKIFETKAIRPINFYPELTSQYPLLSYAAYSWTLHIVDVSNASWDVISAFLATRRYPNGGNYGLWIQFISNGSFPPDVIEQTSPLYYAASFGFDRLISVILANETPLDLEQPGGRHGSTALQVACFRQHHQAAKLLLEAGANPLPTNPPGHGEGIFYCLFWAKENGWDDLVQLMAERINSGTIPLPEGQWMIYIRQLASHFQKSAFEDVKHLRETLAPLWFRIEVPGRGLSAEALEEWVRGAFVELHDCEGSVVGREGSSFVFDVPRRLSQVRIVEKGTCLAVLRLALTSL